MVFLLFSTLVLVLSKRLSIKYNNTPVGFVRVSLSVWTPQRCALKESTVAFIVFTKIHSEGRVSFGLDKQFLTRFGDRSVRFGYRTWRTHLAAPVRPRSNETGRRRCQDVCGLRQFPNCDDFTRKNNIKKNVKLHVIRYRLKLYSIMKYKCARRIREKGPLDVREILQKESIIIQSEHAFRNESPGIAEPGLYCGWRDNSPSPAETVRRCPENGNRTSTKSQQHSSRRNADAACSRSFERI